LEVENSRIYAHSFHVLSSLVPGRRESLMLTLACTSSVVAYPYGVSFVFLPRTSLVVDWGTDRPSRLPMPRPRTSPYGAMSAARFIQALACRFTWSRATRSTPDIADSGSGLADACHIISPPCMASVGQRKLIRRGQASRMAAVVPSQVQHSAARQRRQAPLRWGFAVKGVVWL
jgi:hypothetical protein